MSLESSIRPRQERHPWLTPEYLKYSGMSMQGKKAFSDGTVKEFTGRKKGEIEFITALSFDEPSVATFEDKVARPFAELEKRYGLELDIEGRGSGVHSTLHLAALREGSSHERDRIFAEMADAMPVIDLAQLPGEILFNRIIVDRNGTNALLVATQIPPEITKARAELKGTYGQFPFEDTNYDDILHITVARILKRPEDPAALIGYRNDLLDLSRQVYKDPVVLRPYRVLSGPLAKVNETVR